MKSKHDIQLESTLHQDIHQNDTQKSGIAQTISVEHFLNWGHQ
jgi:hypothetical protein